MKFLTGFLLSTAVLLVTVSVTHANDGACYKAVDTACRGVEDIKSPLGKDGKCSAQFGKFPSLNTDIEDLIQHHLDASMQFLTIGNHFGEWNINRKGFFEYFHKMSDAAWEDAISILQHMVKRGGKLSDSFHIPAPSANSDFSEVTEIHALSKALDIQKNLARSTLVLISKATHGPFLHNATTGTPSTTPSPTSDTAENILRWETLGYKRDGELAHFLADHVSDRQVMRIKDLANHVNALSQALDGADSKLVLYIYDTQVLQ